MGKGKHYKSTHDRAKLIQSLTARYYERENNARCYKAVWKKFIYPVYPMCYKTYLNYLNLPPDPPAQEGRRNPGLFDGFPDT